MNQIMGDVKNAPAMLSESFEHKIILKKKMMLKMLLGKKMMLRESIDEKSHVSMDTFPTGGLIL